MLGKKRSQLSRGENRREKEKSLKLPTISSMAFSTVCRYIALMLLLFCALSVESVDKDPTFSFSFENFEMDRNFGERIALYGGAEIRNSTVEMFGKGRLMWKRPIRFLGTNPSFSTNFSFSISKSNAGSVDFFTLPRNHRSSFRPKFLVVKFGTGHNGSHIAIDAGGEISAVNWMLESEQKLHSWIDYDGALKKIEVRVSKSRDLRPSSSIISRPIDLSNALWREGMYVGISSSNGDSSNIYSWSFEVKHGAPYNMHSEPLDPESFSKKSDYEGYPIRQRGSFRRKTLMALFVGVVCGAFVASIVFYLRSMVAKRYPIAPVEYPDKIVLDGNNASCNVAK